jgi:transposase, IS30 family
LNQTQIANAFNSKIYFCDAYKSYQKGTIENGNRLLREDFPRRINILAVNQIEIYKHVELTNNRPIKCLGYKTLNEIYNQYINDLLKVRNF